ncbi:MAG: leucine--tRNA ligase [Candidatus Micrarchaeota archaeon]|nr:leucine--tRNA ligase [Candidatus Micrarchaeota archaeon]
MNEFNLVQIDKKWQKRWQEAKIFEPKPEKKEKFYLTAAYPYPNSPQHIGHARTYTIADIVARFNKMIGKNVLFPMAFHVTGTPIFAMAKRIEDNDPEMIEIFEKIYGIEKSKIKQLTDPKKLVLYFSDEIEKGMKRIGYSIDWTRKFYTFDGHYTKFIEWQFIKLNKQGLLEKASHPVPWCIAENQAIGAHDTKGDVDPEIEQVILVFFYEEESGVYFPTATYRPDTLPATTNIWINPQIEYVLVEYENKKMIMAKKAAELLAEQLELKILQKVDALKYIGKKVLNPLTKEKIPIFRAKFVKEEVGSGVVMSVPAHAPYDYVALKNLKEEEFKQVKIVSALKTEEYGSCPAVDLVEKNKIEQEDDPRLEELTKEIYQKEAHQGIMLAKDFEGMKSSVAKEKIKEQLLKDKNGILIYILANGPIYSRAGNICTVKIVKDQWFINYSKKDWKEKTKLALENMKIIPQKLRPEFEYTIDWLEKKACTRSKGFGTKYPFDKSQVIEALSDSTIYMAYYTISHIVKNKDPKELDEEFFDYVFLGINSKNKKKWWDECREEFEYWYPLDSRHSAIDLVHNHLTFFIFNHVAIWPKKYWPKQIVANALVTMEGKKMSKSFGNILPLIKALDKYGADLVRLAVSSTAEIDASSDFSESIVEGAKTRLIFFYEILEKYRGQKPKDKKEDLATKLFYSKLHRKIEECYLHYQNLELKQIAQKIFYEMYNDIEKYLKTCPSPYLREFLEYWSLLICPIMPHTAEEFFEKLGEKYYIENSEFATTSTYPKADKKQINAELEKKEEYFQNLIEDIQQIKKLSKIENPKKVIVIVAGNYKYKIIKIVQENIQEQKKVFEKILKEKEFEKYKSNLFVVTNKIMKNISQYINFDLNQNKEIEYLKELKEQLKTACLAEMIEIIKEEEVGVEFAKKAINSLPAKPAIIFVG